MKDIDILKEVVFAYFKFPKKTIKIKRQAAWWKIRNTIHENRKSFLSKNVRNCYTLTCEPIEGVNMGVGDGKKCFLEESKLKPEERVRVRGVAQWLRIRLPMQGTQVPSLVREDPTGCGATKPVRHNY